jgi:hypothetical protein
VSQHLINHPRLAWDGAQSLVSGCLSGSDYPWLSERVRTLLGPPYDDALWQSRLRLVCPERPDARQVEVGTWRVRLEDALRDRPEIAEEFLALVAEVRARVP